jgi:DNA helicase-2/ATP-dependent DNA helicase PcrA
MSEEFPSSPLTMFLTHAALESGDEIKNIERESVQLMTLHAAKGLEFNTVFLSGMEEGLFPHQLSVQEERRLEEERRLCYVGITRAMKKLYLTYAESRRLHGTEHLHRPSRFIYEIPTKLIQELRVRTNIARPMMGRAPQVVFHDNDDHENDLHIGQHVAHPLFGEGVIINCEGSGNQARVQVKFNKQGTKWLLVSMAKLEKVHG